MTVFVVQETPGKNILPAARFGELKVLLPPGQIQVDAMPAVRRLSKLLSDFCDEDHLLCIGDPVAIAIAAAIAAANNNGRLKLLKWDRQEGQYYSVEADTF